MALPLTLAQATARLQPEPSDPVELAERLIDFAERTPVFRYRQEPARAALVRAGELLPGRGRADLEARILLRLASVELDRTTQAALNSAEEAERRFGDDAAGRVACLCLRSRATRRLGKSEEADQVLRQAAESGAAAERRHFIGLTQAIADKQTEESSPDVVAVLRGMLNLLDGERLEEFDARFQAHFQLALALRIQGRPDAELKHLRSVVSLVKAHDAPLDLLEARLALGTALAAAKETVEARRVLQVVIDQARDMDEEQIRLLGLTAMVAVLSDSNAVQGAVGTAIQSASGYAERGDLFGYIRSVTLASQVLLAHGHEVRAVEILMYGVAALKQQMGEESARMLQMQLDAIREEWGEARYEAVCRKLLEVRAARRRLEQKP